MKVFCLLAALLFLYLLVDGWRQQAVWVKAVGIRALLANEWFYRINRKAQAIQYWLTMLMYGWGLILMLFVMAGGLTLR